MTNDLLALADWLAEHGVTHVAMESSRMYWTPIWNRLEDRFDLLAKRSQHQDSPGP
jgi:transposase